jgi:hypothetical protein
MSSDECSQSWGDGAQQGEESKVYRRTTYGRDVNGLMTGLAETFNYDGNVSYRKEATGKDPNGNVTYAVYTLNAAASSVEAKHDANQGWYVSKQDISWSKD